MKLLKLSYRFRFLAILFIFSICSCVTLDYRGIQAQFEQAVQLDNGQSVSAFTESSTITEPGYADVSSQLTPEYINKLDERLRPNAWLILAVSQWRTGKFTEARESAKNGENEPALQQQSRDHVLLMLIPGLVIDMEIEKVWEEAGKKFTSSQYAKAEKDYTTVFDIFSKAEKAMGPATPPNTRHYLNYQRWRVIQGWRSVINSIISNNGQPDDDAQNKALADAKKYFKGTSLQEAANSFKSSIPPGHSLWELITAQSR